MITQIDIPEQKIREFCQHHHIIKMSIFGSALSEDFNAASDLDILVEFDPDHVPGWEFVSIQDELSAIMGIAVDLNTAGFLSETFREDVLRQAVVIYERA